MSSGNPFTITVFDKHLARVGWVGDPSSLNGSIRHNSLSNMQLVLAAGDPMIAPLMEKGARVAIDYRGQRIGSFKVRNPNGSFSPNGPTQFQLQGDWRLLRNSLAWVASNYPLLPDTLYPGNNPGYLGQSHYPGGGSDVQPTPPGNVVNQWGYFKWPDGSGSSGGVMVRYSETAVQWVVGSNLNRLHHPVTFAPDLQRGGDILAAGMLPQLRFPTLEEAAMPILDWSGLGLRLCQEDDVTPTILVSMYEPNVWPAKLTFESQIIRDGTWSISDPSATRGVLGGPGEDVMRAFWEVLDATGLEDDYGDVIELWGDATGTNLQWPEGLADDLQVAKYYLLRPEVSATDKANFMAYMNTAANKMLEKGRPSASVRVVLGETESFHFGGADGIQLGDQVTVVTPTGLEVTDRVREVEFKYSQSNGLEVTPIIGEPTLNPDPIRQLANAVAGLAASQRRMSAAK